MEAVKENPSAETEQAAAAEAARKRSGETDPIPPLKMRPPVSLPTPWGETDPIPPPKTKPPVALRTASGGLGPIPLLESAEPSQLFPLVNGLIAEINARLGLIQPSAVTKEEKPAEAPAPPAQGKPKT